AAVPGDLHTVGEHAMAPDLHVVRDMRLNLKLVVVADPSDPTAQFRPRMHRHMLPEYILRADHQPRIAPAELQILGIAPDDTPRQHLAPRPNLRIPRYDRGRMQTAPLAQLDARPHIAARTDLDVGSELGCGIHARGRGDPGHSYCGSASTIMNR